jgi:hypothetical protein
VTISILSLKVNAGGLEVIDTQNNLEITNLSEGTSKFQFITFGLFFFAMKYTFDEFI